MLTKDNNEILILVTKKMIKDQGKKAVLRPKRLKTNKQTTKTNKRTNKQTNTTQHNTNKQKRLVGRSAHFYFFILFYLLKKIYFVAKITRKEHKNLGFFSYSLRSQVCIQILVPKTAEFTNFLCLKKISK